MGNERRGKTMSHEYFYGVDQSTDQHHDLCYDRFIGKYPDLACYRFGVADNLSSVEVTYDGNGSNGIWMLAEVLAGGESLGRSEATNLRTIDRLAALMQEELSSSK